MLVHLTNFFTNVAPILLTATGSNGFMMSIALIHNILFGAVSTGQGIQEGLRYVGGGVAMIGAMGSGIGQGYAGGQATSAIGRNPEAENKVRTQMIISAAIAETCAIYCLVIALIIIFVG